MALGGSRGFGGGYRWGAGRLGGPARAGRLGPPPRPPVMRPPRVQGVSQRISPGPARRAPGVTAPTATTPGAPAYPSPYDSTYYQQLNSATLAANQRINAYNQQSGYARVDEQNALAQLAHQQPIDTLNTQEAANRQGLLYSGHLGNQLGELNRAYLQRQSADQQALERGQAARDAAVAAVRSGLSLTQAALAAAAAERASTAAEKNPALGMPTGPGVGMTKGPGWRGDTGFGLPVSPPRPGPNAVPARGRGSGRGRRAPNTPLRNTGLRTGYGGYRWGGTAY